MKKKSSIHIVAGPTAGGKSAFALDLAKKLDGVIINADSRQVYNDLAILTAQPAAPDKAEAPHELYGVLHPNDSCSAGNWRELAEPVIEQTIAQGKTPIVVGGTGLYIKALIEGLSPIPDVPEDIRAQAVKKQEELGNPAFYKELEKRDPETAKKFHPFHTARLVRAWEVLEATGKGLAEWQRLDKLAPPDHWQFEIHKIMPGRDELHRRCDGRFEQMIQNGAIEETRAFLDKIKSGEVAENTLLVKSLGFKPLRAYIEGEMPLDEAITKAQTETRQYAKRQVTWFRHQL